MRRLRTSEFVKQTRSRVKVNVHLEVDLTWRWRLLALLIIGMLSQGKLLNESTLLLVCRRGRHDARRRNEGHVRITASCDIHGRGWTHNQERAEQADARYSV